MRNPMDQIKREKKQQRLVKIKKIKKNKNIRIICEVKSVDSVILLRMELCFDIMYCI